MYEQYTYDSRNGNRSSAQTPSGVVNFQDIVYDTQDRLTRYAGYSYDYTKNGELKTKTQLGPGGVVTTYSYDVFGNLISVAPSNGPTITYLIDGMNRRVGKKVGTTLVQQWLYRDSLKPVAELDGQGNLVSVFVYGSNQSVPDYMFRGGQTYRILTDQIGSPRLVVNVANSSDVQFSATYTAFGETVASTGLGFLPFGFASGLYDKDTGLVRFGARGYDPVVGRWTAKDPIRFGGDQANLYMYIVNDPVNRIDQDGRASDCDMYLGLLCGLLCEQASGAAGKIGGSLGEGLGPAGAIAGATGAAAFAGILCAAACIEAVGNICHPPEPTCDPSTTCCSGAPPTCAPCGPPGGAPWWAR